MELLNRMPMNFALSGKHSKVTKHQNLLTIVLEIFQQTRLFKKNSRIAFLASEESSDGKV